jgi:hypothetical protein
LSSGRKGRKEYQQPGQGKQFDHGLPPCLGDGQKPFRQHDTAAFAAFPPVTVNLDTNFNSSQMTVRYDNYLEA